MKTVKGVVSKIFPNEGKKSGPGLKIDGNGTVYLGQLSFTSLGITEGVTIEAQGNEVGSRGNIAVDSAANIKVLQGEQAQSAQASTPAQRRSGGGGRGGQPANSDERIAMQNCHGIAAQVLATYLANDIVAMPAKASGVKAAEIKQPEKLEAAEALFDRIADRLFARVMAAHVQWVPTAEYLEQAGPGGRNEEEAQGDLDPNDDIPF